MHPLKLAWIAGAFTALAFAKAHSQATLPVEKIKLPPGLKIEVFNSQLPGARSLALSPSGTLFVGTRDEGRVYAIPEATKGGTRVVTLASNLKMPNGVA